MKRIVTFLLGLVLCLSAMAQAQITTKKEKLSDFGSKTMKVVLTGSPFLDESLREAAKNTWYLSPYETCTADEFERLKTSDSYYFLVTAEIRGKKEDEARALTWIKLVKGGAQVKELSDMLEVVRLPLCAAGKPSGREDALLPALLENMQAYVLQAQSSDLKGFGSVVSSLRRSGKKEVWLVDEELSPQIGKDFLQRKASVSLLITDADEADAVMRSGRDAVVGFCIAPAEPVKGGTCYKYLIDARTHEIYAYKQHKISSTTGAGFLKSDLNAIIQSR